jgi:hypothetical protein
MASDKLTKVILSAIAVALWIIAINPWLRPVPVSAQEEKIDLRKIESSLSEIHDDTSSLMNDFRRVARGVCTNPKLC